MGNERVVEVPKVESHPMFSAAFIERSSRVLPRTGLAFRGAEHQGPQGLLTGQSSTAFRGAEHQGLQGLLTPKIELNSILWSRTSRPSRSSRFTPPRTELNNVLWSFWKNFHIFQVLAVIVCYFHEPLASGFFLGGVSLLRQWIRILRQFGG